MTGTRKPLQTYVCQQCRKRRLEVFTGPDGRMVAGYRPGRMRSLADAHRKAEGEDWRNITGPLVQPVHLPVTMRHGEREEVLLQEVGRVTLRPCKCDKSRAMPTELLRRWLATGRRVVEIPHNGVLPLP